MSQPQAAQALSVSPTALSMWENGHRRPDIDQMQALDRAYDAGGALIDMAVALRTPDGLAPRHTWAHNPQGPSRPHWAWLRPRQGSCRVIAWLRWGAFHLQCSEACDDRGIFVTTSVSMPNPAAWVHLREPGWVDFGCGEVPDQLGIPAVDALPRANVVGDGHSPAGLVTPAVVDRFINDATFADRVIRFFGDRADLVRQVFATTEGWNRVTRITAERTAPTDPHDPFSGPEYRRLREARYLSQHDAAALATELLPGEPVTDDQIGLLERGGSPRRTHLRTRLDTVYRADGFTCREETRPSPEARVRGLTVPFTFDFPRFWVGPVWITVQPPPAATEAHVRLDWDEQYKDLLIGTTSTLTCRRPEREAGPLRMFCPTGWRVKAGVGHHPWAWDANLGWHRDDAPRPTAPEPRPPVNTTFLGWFNRTEDELHGLLSS